MLGSKQPSYQSYSPNHGTSTFECQRSSEARDSNLYEKTPGLSVSQQCDGKEDLFLSASPGSQAIRVQEQGLTSRSSLGSASTLASPEKAAPDKGESKEFEVSEKRMNAVPAGSVKQILSLDCGLDIPEPNKLSSLSLKLYLQSSESQRSDPTALSGFQQSHISVLEESNLNEDENVEGKKNLPASSSACRLEIPKCFGMEGTYKDIGYEEELQNEEFDHSSRSNFVDYSEFRHRNFFSMFQSPSSETFLSKRQLYNQEAEVTLKKLIDCISNMSSLNELGEKGSPAPQTFECYSEERTRKLAPDKSFFPSRAAESNDMTNSLDRLVNSECEKKAFSSESPGLSTNTSFSPVDLRNLSFLTSPTRVSNEIFSPAMSDRGFSDRKDISTSGEKPGGGFIKANSSRARANLQDDSMSNLEAMLGKLLTSFGNNEKSESVTGDLGTLDECSGRKENQAKNGHSGQMFMDLETQKVFEEWSKRNIEKEKEDKTGLESPSVLKRIEAEKSSAFMGESQFSSVISQNLPISRSTHITDEALSSGTQKSGTPKKGEKSREETPASPLESLDKVYVSLPENFRTSGGINFGLEKSCLDFTENWERTERHPVCENNPLDGKVYKSSGGSSNSALAREVSEHGNGCYSAFPMQEFLNVSNSTKRKTGATRNVKSVYSRRKFDIYQSTLDCRGGTPDMKDYIYGGDASRDYSTSSLEGKNSGNMVLANRFHQCPMLLESASEVRKSVFEEQQHQCLIASNELAALRNDSVKKVYSDDRDRMVYISWIPKKARAYTMLDKRRMELDLKRRLKEQMFLLGLTKVLLFPPKGVHCKLIFDKRNSAAVFMQNYGGDNRSAETEKWKVDLCKIYNIEMSNKFDNTIVKIEWSQK